MYVESEPQSSGLPAAIYTVYTRETPSFEAIVNVFQAKPLIFLGIKEDFSKEI
jgi:hypothetical protein